MILVATGGAPTTGTRGSEGIGIKLGFINDHMVILTFDFRILNFYSLISANLFFLS